MERKARRGRDVLLENIVDMGVARWEGFPPRRFLSLAVIRILSVSYPAMITKTITILLPSSTHPALGRNTDGVWVVPASHTLRSLGSWH